MPPPDEPILLRTQEDALAFALVAELFRPFDRLLALADADGRARVVIVDPTDALVRRCGAVGLPVAVVVSTEDAVAGPLRERDIAAFRAARASFEAEGVDLVDWVMMTPDGELYRSLSISIDVLGW